MLKVATGAVGAGAEGAGDRLLVDVAEIVKGEPDLMERGSGFVQVQATGLPVCAGRHTGWLQSVGWWATIGE
jgi:hypothetical protein